MKSLVHSACFLPVIVFVASLVAPAAAAEPAVRAPVGPAGQPDKIKELQDKRIAVLKEIVEINEKGFKAGQVSFEQVIKARLDLLQAQLDASPTKEERVRLLEEMVKQAEELEKAVERLAAAKQVGRVDVLKATAFVLETRIALERARVAKGP